jgi:CelD/BcsL family acetyltransferase involved in cellulose biosynthesis
MFQIEEVRTLAHMEALRTEWGELQEATGERSIFLTHAWFLVCARHLLPGQRTLIVLLREGQRLVGIAPLMEQRAKVRRVPIRQVSFLQNPLSPFSDFLLLDGPKGLSAILDYLWESHRNWDLLCLNQWRQESTHLEVFCSLLRNRRNVFQRHVVSRSPYLPITQSWEDFYRSKPQKFRKTRRSISNRMMKLGETSLELISRPEDAESGLQQLLRVSERGWKRQQQADLLASELEQALLGDIIRVASERGWLRLWLLKLGEQALAAELHLDDHGTSYGLRAQYDETYAHYSPGSYLDFLIVRRLFQGGCSCYNMGPGTAEYKLAWTDLTRVCYGIEVYNSTIYGRMLSWLQNQVIPTLKESLPVRWIRKSTDSSTQGVPGENGSQ